VETQMVGEADLSLFSVTDSVEQALQGLGIPRV
jgi:hypothetical protein